MLILLRISAPCTLVLYFTTYAPAPLIPWFSTFSHFRYILMFSVSSEQAHDRDPRSFLLPSIVALFLICRLLSCVMCYILLYTHMQACIIDFSRKMASLLPDNDTVVVYSSDFEHDDAKELKMVSTCKFMSSCVHACVGAGRCQQHALLNWARARTTIILTDYHRKTHAHIYINLTLIQISTQRYTHFHMDTHT